MPDINLFKISRVYGEEVTLTDSDGQAFVCPKRLIPDNLKVDDDVAVLVENPATVINQKQQTAKEILRELLS